jgi:hypothetical protein
VTVEAAVETVKATVMVVEAASESVATGVSAVGGEEGGGPKRITSIGCAAQEDSHK